MIDKFIDQLKRGWCYGGHNVAGHLLAKAKALLAPQRLARPGPGLLRPWAHGPGRRVTPTLGGLGATLAQGCRAAGGPWVTRAELRKWQAYETIGLEVLAENEVKSICGDPWSHYFLQSLLGSS